MSLTLKPELDNASVGIIETFFQKILPLTYFSGFFILKNFKGEQL